MNGLLLAAASAWAASPEGSLSDGTGPVHPWRRNEVLRDWPYECPGWGLHPPVTRRTIPRNRVVRGFHCSVPHDEGTCEEGTSTPVEPGRSPPGAMSPADALALWNTGDVQVDWCLADADTWLTDGPIASAARADPEATATWQFIGWSNARRRHVNKCPWRQVLLVPVLLDVGTGDGALAGTLALWLVVSSDDPETWTLTSREWAGVEVEVGGALEPAWRGEFGAPGIEPTASYLWFDTDGTFGHRQLRLGLSPTGDPALRAEVNGQWRWVARP